jgi:hypothetical protein
MSALRPIGTRFTEYFPPSENCTDPYGHKHTFEVVGHVKVSRFLGDKEGVMAEEIKTIDVEKVQPEWMWMKIGVLTIGRQAIGRPYRGNARNGVERKVGR